MFSGRVSGCGSACGRRELPKKLTPTRELASGPSCARNVTWSKYRCSDWISPFSILKIEDAVIGDTITGSWNLT
jgi:hypothetical protein